MLALLLIGLFIPTVVFGARAVYAIRHGMPWRQYATYWSLVVALFVGTTALLDIWHH
jgi:ABC-type transport system involved in cytochrome c biogenesis permease component